MGFEIHAKSMKIVVFCICLCLLDGLPRFEIQVKSSKINVFCICVYAYLMDSRGSTLSKIDENRCFLHMFMLLASWIREAQN